MRFGVVVKVEMGSCIEKKHPGSAGRCLRQKDVLRLTLPALPVMLLEDGAGLTLCHPGFHCRGEPAFQPQPLSSLLPPFWLAAQCPVPSGLGKQQQGWASSPGHPHPSRSPFPSRAALPTPGCRHRLLLSPWQRRERVALININTASAAPSPSF